MSDSLLTYSPATQSFYCAGCRETTKVRRKDAGDPEALLNLKEQIGLDHAECVEGITYGRTRRSEAERRTQG
jgi:hypothetical protein